ncbi:hypothetical protein ABPG74_009371 [Tetrahymena malaccensis]
MSTIYNKPKNNNKKLSPYMYLIHDNLKKEELVHKYQNFISDQHNQVLGLRGIRAKSNYVSKQAPKLPFEPHYNHEINRSGEKDYLLMHKNRSVGNNQFNLTNNEELESSNFMKYNTHQDITPERGNSLMQNDNYESTVKKATRVYSSSPGGTAKKNSIKKKTMGTSIKARYEKLRDILEERNEELEKERLIFLGCIQKIKELRIKYFGESEAYFIDPNENSKNSFDKEYCALELCIEQYMQKNQDVNKSMQEFELKVIQSEKQKNQSTLSELQKEKEGFQLKMLEKEKIIQELHKALKVSDADVQSLSKEIHSLQYKLKEAQQMNDQQQEQNKKMAKRMKELKKIEEYGTTNLLVQQEIDNLKSSKTDIERKYYELKHKVGDISKLKEDNINLKLELDHRIKDLTIENEKITREYQILIKEYKITKAKQKQLEEEAIKNGANSQALQETQQKISAQVQKDLEIEKQYYENKIANLKKENEQLQDEVDIVKKKQRDLASVTYTKEDFERMTADNSKRIQELEDKINDLTTKNKKLVMDTQSLEKLKSDIDNLKKLYEEEKSQNKELKQKINIQEKAYNEFQYQQKVIQENLRVQLDQTQHQIESIRHQQSIQKQSIYDDENEEKDNKSQQNQSFLSNTHSNQVRRSSQKSKTEEDYINQNKNNNSVIIHKKNQQQEESSSIKSGDQNQQNIVIIQKQMSNQDKKSTNSRYSENIKSNNQENSKEYMNGDVVIPPSSNKRLRSVSQTSNYINQNKEQSQIMINFQQKEKIQQKILNESMVNLSQKSRNTQQQAVVEQKVNSTQSHKQPGQSNNSGLKINKNNNSDPISPINKEQTQIQIYVNTDQTHSRPKQRARSQMSHYSREDQKIVEFDGLSESSQQYSKLEKEEILSKQKLQQQKLERNNNSKQQNNRRSFLTQPDQEIKKNY